MNTVRVIVTRPACEAMRWVEQLQQGGFSAEALPLIEIAPDTTAASVQALDQAWQTLESYCACLFVSGNAVNYFFRKKSTFTQDERAQSATKNVANTILAKLPASLRFMAPGPGTVAALVAAGVPASQIDAPAPDADQFDSQALWKAVGQRNWQGRRVLVVRGESLEPAGLKNTASPGRDWIARQWEAAGARVDFVSVYQRRIPLLSESQIERARLGGADGSIWLFSSSQAVANLAGLPALSAMDWHCARAVVTHPRIAEAVRAAGWGVVVESRPALKDIKETLASIESNSP